MSEFGDCPQCGILGALLPMVNFGREHWLVCDECRVRWFIGENLFSSWRDESPEVQAANRRRYESFRVAQPTRASGRALRIMSIKEILDEADEREALPIDDPRHPRGFEIDDSHLSLYWSYPYHIDLRRIDAPTKALGWLSHVCEKSWKGVTPRRVHNLIEALAHRFGWSIHGM